MVEADSVTVVLPQFAGPNEKAQCVQAGAEIDPFLVETCVMDQSIEADATPIESGEVYGHYVIVRLIGKGGQGRIFLARDTITDKLVALKTMRSMWIDSEAARRRFRKEVLALAPLVHPNIVTISHAFVHETMPFLVMEYVDGQTLADCMWQRRMENGELLDIFLTCCDAMEYAHVCGIIHLDLKPQNILITGDGTPKIVDFGIARNLCRKKKLKPTCDVSIAGSPAYMAPEQASNAQRQIGPHTDVYALGTILYQLLTGEVPHSGETPRLVLNRVMTVQPDPPLKRNPFIGRELNAICMKALAKDPKDRYPTAGVLAQDLRDYLDGKEITTAS
jgi:eukaryotic-like serine/threonine-protein kinase